MTTETELRTALRGRAADAPTVDPDRLLAGVDHAGPVLRSTAGTSHGRRWAIAGVAAGFVALAAVAAGLVVGGDGADTSAPAGPVSAASSPTVTSDAASTFPPSTSPPASTTTAWPVDPSAPTQPRPIATDWVDPTSGVSPTQEQDDSAIVFSATGDPADGGITGFYVRDHQQLSVLPVGGTAKDNSDATSWTAVQVYLPGSGFDVAALGNPTSVVVNGVARKFVTLPRMVGSGPIRQVPSLLWPVGEDWVVLQVDLVTPTASPTLDQLVAAAARIDVHHG